MAQSTGILHRSRNDESWINISTQPSSLAGSSINHAHPSTTTRNDTFTTSLRISSNQSPQDHRRRSHTRTTGRTNATSSQEEYEESESEDDGPALASSSDHILPVPKEILAPLRQRGVYASSEEDNKNAKAMGFDVTSRSTIVAGEEFTPQPNAFSHPPATRRPGGRRYVPVPNSGTARPGPSFNQRNSAAFTREYKGVTDDHDAALRASLTTLLSCAAAARGLPKRDEGRMGMGLGPTFGRHNGMGTISIIPEGDLAKPSSSSKDKASKRPVSPSPAKSREHDESSTKTGDRPSKRKASSSSAMQKPYSATDTSRKKRVSSPSPTSSFYTRSGNSNGISALSPALLPWVVSAGVVVLVSVVGFGAGYVIGREVGRSELMMGSPGDRVLALGNVTGACDAGLEIGCGREGFRGGGTAAGAGLRRWRSVAP